MPRKSSPAFESIADLYGDVVQDAPSVLYVDNAPPSAAAGPPRDSDLALDPETLSARRRRPPPGRVRDAAVEFRDDNGLISGIVLLHGLLTVVTLGLWRFWMKSNTRAAIWSHTTLEDEPLEWLGKGAELFVGFLFAVVFLAAMLAAANLAIAFLGVSWAVDFETMMLVQALVTLVVGIEPLRQYARYRVRRYRLSRTRWKGIRFGMDGSGLSVVRLWAMWTPFVLLSGFLLFPVWRWARERHLARRMRWGDARFRLVQGPGPLILPWLCFWSGCAFLVALALSPQLRALLGPFDPVVIWQRGLFGSIAMLMTTVFVLWLLWTAYRAAELRTFLGGLEVGGARLRSSLSMMHLVDAYFMVGKRNIWPGLAVYVLIALVTAIPFYGAFSVEMADPRAESLIEGLQYAEGTLFEGFATWRAQSLVIMAMILNYALAAVFQMWLWIYVYGKRVHEHICDTLQVEGLHHLDAVRQGARDRQTQAEGFADALDLGAAA